MGILVTRKPSHTIILPTWHGGNRYSTLEHAASRAKHHGGHISPIRLRRKHCCYFSRKEKDGAHLLNGSSDVYRLNVFHINELNSEFGSDLSQPAQWGKQAPNSAWQLWCWWMRTCWGKGVRVPLNCDSAEDDGVWWHRGQQRKTGSKTLPNRRGPSACGSGWKQSSGPRRAWWAVHQGMWKLTAPCEQAYSSSLANSPPKCQDWLGSKESSA